MHKAIGLAEAVEMIPDGASLMIGGFMGVGSPHRLIGELLRQGRKDLTVIGNDAARPGVGIGRLVDAKVVKRMVASHIGTNPEIGRQMIAGETIVELCPQGTLAERIRAGGAGIPAFFTATGVGTQIAEGKPTQEFDGRMYVQERGLRADLSIVHAWKADMEGNLVFRKTARNFNPIMATAGENVVVQVEHLVESGQIDPDHIITPGIFVNRIVKLDSIDKRIEQRTVRKRA